MQYNKLGEPILRRLGKGTSYKTLLETAYHAGIKIRMTNSHLVYCETCDGKILEQKYCDIDNLPETINDIMENQGLIEEEEPKEF